MQRTKVRHDATDIIVRLFLPVRRTTPPTGSAPTSVPWFLNLSCCTRTICLLHFVLSPLLALVFVVLLPVVMSLFACSLSVVREGKEEKPLPQRTSTRLSFQVERTDLDGRNGTSTFNRTERKIDVPGRRGNSALDSFLILLRRRCCSTWKSIGSNIVGRIRSAGGGNGQGRANKKRKLGPKPNHNERPASQAVDSQQVRLIRSV